MAKIGLIGYGYWGRNLARNFQSNPAAVLARICDADPACLVRAEALQPGVRTTTRAEDLIEDASLDAIVLATPPATHFPLGMAALRAGKHLWVEKPIACTSEEAGLLVEEARRRKLVLMVDHTFVYAPVVRKIGELIRSGNLGSLYYYDSVRTNLGRFQSDVGVLWDLAYHDLAILDYLIDEQPSAVSAHGAAHWGTHDEVSYLSLTYPSGFHAHVHVSWLTPVKIRRVMLTGSKRMLLWDDLENTRKLEIYDHTIEPESGAGQLRINYRSGEIHSPWLDVSEPLQNAVSHFLECIETGAQPLTGGEAGLRVTRILERAQPVGNSQ